MRKKTKQKCVIAHKSKKNTMCVCVCGGTWSLWALLLVQFRTTNGPVCVFLCIYEPLSRSSCCSELLFPVATALARWFCRTSWALFILVVVVTEGVEEPSDAAWLSGWPLNHLCCTAHTQTTKTPGSRTTARIHKLPVAIKAEHTHLHTH